MELALLKRHDPLFLPVQEKNLQHSTILTEDPGSSGLPAAQMGKGGGPGGEEKGGGEGVRDGKENAYFP